MMLRDWISPSLRKEIRVWIRFVRDIISGDQFRFANPKKNNQQFKDLQVQHSISQPIRKNASSENKRHNLKLASAKINRTIIGPGRVFSFWYLVGNPSIQRGYKKGRNVVAGKLIEETGGGLCQLSGIIYLLALETGLEITERHNHSIDIYTDETRYTPLGSDATVVYGYKDLRIRNPYPFDILFEITVNADEVNAKLLSASGIKSKVLTFNTVIEDGKKVARVTDFNGSLISESWYR